MKLFNQVRRYGAQVRTGVAGAGLALSAMIASATPTDPFTTAVSDATDRIETYAGALVTLGAVAVLFMIALKYVKKIPRAS